MASGTEEHAAEHGPKLSFVYCVRVHTLFLAKLRSLMSSNVDEAGGHRESVSGNRRHRRRRTRTGCRTCRARKVKCDERRDGCTNCERMKLICPGYNGTNSSQQQEQELTEPSAEYPLPANSSPLDYTLAGIRRQRIQQSCNTCRSSKLKCDGDHPCMRCSKKGVRCTYAGNGTRSSSQRNDHTPQAAITQVTDSTNTDPASSHDWLQATQLPDPSRVRILVHHYFLHVHPLRCFGFLHKPSFLQQLDSTRPQDVKHQALLHIICALGAKFVALEKKSVSSKHIQLAGNSWAAVAKKDLLSNLESISVENLMTAVLLQDLSIRQGDYSLAFMLTGIMTRMSQALQINLEYSADVLCQEQGPSLSCTNKESRRRLMFSCYVADVTVGSGVEQLTLLNEKDIKIQLPCDERLFLIQQPCLTETLQPGQVLHFIAPAMVPNDPTSNMGIQSFYIRLTAIRKRLLTYVKHLSAASPPWLPDSEFAILDSECTKWYGGLPSNLRFKAANLYIRSETGEIGSLCALHATYHLSIIDLYRIFVPTLYRLRGASAFPPEQEEFVRHYQSAIDNHARKLAEIAREGFVRKGIATLGDFWWPTVLFESCRHMIYYETKLSPDAPNRLSSDTRELVKSNIELLQKLQGLTAMAEPLSLRAMRLLEDNHSDYDHDPDDLESSPSVPGTPTQTAPDYVLHPLSIYRMARKSIPEKHAPEKTSPAATLTSPGSSSLQMHRRSVEASDTAFSDSARYQIAHTERNFGQRVFAAPSTQQLNANAELDLFFPPDLSTVWQPAETLADSANTMEVPPWMVMPDQSAYGFNSWFANG